MAANYQRDLHMDRRSVEYDHFTGFADPDIKPNHHIAFTA
jgi:hypothetical protein